MRLHEIEQSPEIASAGKIVQGLYDLFNEPLQWDNDKKPTIRDLVKQLDNPFLISITTDLNTFLHYGQAYIDLDRSDIFSSTTGLPTYDDMMRDPEYFATNKNTVFKKVKMYPSLYRTYTKQGFQKTDNFTPDNNLMFDYAKQVLDGSKMPLTYLKYSLFTDKRGGEYTAFGQEGRHRATVAELLNAHKIPVLIIASTDNANSLDEFSNIIFNKFK